MMSTPLLPRPATVLSHKALADEAPRSALSMASAADGCCCFVSWKCAGSHDARLAATRTKIYRYLYCCRQPTITPLCFFPTILAAGSTRLFCRATLHTTQPPARLRNIYRPYESSGNVQKTPYLLPEYVQQMKTKINAVRT